MADINLALAGGPTYLEAVYSTSPRRSISWVAQDQSGNQTQQTNSTGQPLQSVMYPQVVLQEISEDRLELTRHPVERGTSVTDHAYKQPSRVEIRAGWSFAQPGPAASPQIIPTDPSYLQQLYNVLLQLQQQRIFVTLVTGKRTYTYMLLESLAVHTDQETENILDITASFEQILLAQTQVVSTLDSSLMRRPAINAPVSNQGNTALQPGTNANVPALRGTLVPNFQTATPASQ